MRRALPAARVLCRIEQVGASTADELAAAVRLGADEVLVPMVRSVAEVDAVLAQARCGVGILIETPEAVAAAAELAARPLTRIYLGLNDLAIERGSPTIFAPLVDGTLDSVAAAVGDVPFGFGGLTLPERGAPVPARLLAAEMARIGTSFTFLRRSFWRDASALGVGATVRAIASGVEAARRRSADAVARDRAELVRIVGALIDDPPAA